MGMSTHIEGFKPPDEKWKKMKKIWDSCTEADMMPPEEVSEFFNWETPDELGVTVDEKKLGKGVREYGAESRDGYEILIDKLPKDVKIIRVFNSY